MFVFNQSHAFCVTADSQVYNSLILQWMTAASSDQRGFPSQLPAADIRTAFSFNSPSSWILQKSRIFWAAVDFQNKHGCFPVH